ncbi:hypothetical protein GCM10027036_26550 [Flavihumibacter cheonanensis]|uniref:hypothetical protein n=1 Tax=Flavihumibacter cheonanensis TaxID=1442385 RepID=UPI001EF8FC20|nr:hypothetical protein [Flavihumibacter cheonanensis]MCG7753322.1 hypothetical protein [Flavihumibacter cheonanensis]
MAKYKSLYLWMLLPMIFMQAGIFEDYWGDFKENAWSVHVHYWTGTVWYLFLILQPYYATHGQLARHRTLGIIGMFMGGAVCLTALSMLYRDIETTQLIREVPGRFGPFEGWFFFGVAALEIVMMVAFGVAVIMSIIERKQLDRHAWWLISTVFIIMMPALGRGIQNVHIAMQIKQWPNVDIMSSLYFTQFIIIAMLLGGAWKYQQLRHPATWLALGVNLVTLLLEPIGRSAAVQQFLQTMIKG